MIYHKLYYTLECCFCQPLYMFYYEGYPINQIAEILDKNENSVKTLLKRGREKLKNVLSKEGYNG